MNYEEKPVIFSLKPIKQEMEPGIYAWCSCGLSSNQPFCDDSHIGTSFKPVKVRIEDRQKISWCACKHSSKGYLCDATHKALALEMEDREKSLLP